MSAVGVVLAAGRGERLRPLTDLRPKALCPVNNVALVDLAVDRLRPHVEAVAVNVHHGRDQMVAHLTGRVDHLSVEEPEALGTAGALGALRDWIAGRDLLVANADAWHRADLAPLVGGDDIRLLVVHDDERGDFGPWRYAGAAWMPWEHVQPLAAVPSGLYEVSWAAAWDAGLLDLVPHDGEFIDCGTPAGYLAANLAASGGASVVGPGAVVEGAVVRSVVWSGCRVAAGERLVDSIRADGGVTVRVGPAASPASPGPAGL